MQEETAQPDQPRAHPLDREPEEMSSDSNDDRGRDSPPPVLNAPDVLDDSGSFGDTEEDAEDEGETVYALIEGEPEDSDESGPSQERKDTNQPADGKGSQEKGATQDAPENEESSSSEGPVALYAPDIAEGEENSSEFSDERPYYQPAKGVNKAAESKTPDKLASRQLPSKEQVKAKQKKDKGKKEKSKKEKKDKGKKKDKKDKGKK
jgi:hypothetical protein